MTAKDTWPAGTAGALRESPEAATHGRSQSRSTTISFDTSLPSPTRPSSTANACRDRSSSPTP